MEVEKAGEEEPEVAVVYCTHGDETAGKKAVEKLLKEDPDFIKGVKFVFANEKAFKQGERLVDTDLNRCFPGDPESQDYEERLAAEMMQELQNVKVLDIHETSTSPVPFSLFTWSDEETIETLRSTGVGKAVEISYTPGCGINHYGGVEVEVGPKGTEEAVNQAHRILKTFLVNSGVLEGEKNFSDPEIYRVYGTRSRPEGDWSSECSNFEPVGKGEKIASGDSGDITASEDFVPVLFSETYEDILGFKAVRLEKVEERIYRRGTENDD
ncbi:MAG: succinylglutamate desuccinylase/aspartoacylase family protein [Candidatus Nanosalina sp.]